MLKLMNISKSYTTGTFTQKALDGLSLNFRKNEFVAILGPSGSGKTTCLNIVGGLDRYDSGDLVINGKSTSSFKESDWDAYRNNSVGFIFQSYNLISHLNIVDNVEIGMTLSGVSFSEKHKKALAVLKKVGLEEHIHKKPNQLSGGQMQRVAIARALANDPDIIMADEPTGALDSQTSVQIMELIKEIAKDKLVIMVTHNANLASTYADRTVKFLDGKVIEDSNPFETPETDTTYKLKKTSMNFFTALKLSFKNILTKKWRTSLTAFASSIGIIGIGIVLALSNGFDKQIESFEKDALAGNPVSINSVAQNMGNFTLRDNEEELQKYPDTMEVYPLKPEDNSRRHTNNFTDEYIKYIENIDTSLLTGISFLRTVQMPVLNKNNGKISIVNTKLLNLSAYPHKMDNGGGDGYIEQSYDLLAGNYPESIYDMVLIVDQQNRLNTVILEALGFDYEAEKIAFDDFIGYEMKIIYNNDYYVKADDEYKVVNENVFEDLYNGQNAITVKITGIIRASENTKMPVLNPGLSYSDELSSLFIEDAMNSDIVKAQMKVNYNITNKSEIFVEASDIAGRNGITKDDRLQQLGASEIPSSIAIYPKNFDAKESILKYLDEWNEQYENEDDHILYTDMAAVIANLSGNILGAITTVLVAFAAVSLIVSMIMIGIIIYISVLERTKEIGVLRALGARKKDVTRVFNAETFIIGTFSGLIGIGIAYLLTIPVNVILNKLTDISGIAQLNPLHAFLLTAISVILTIAGGFIPAKMAAKKDPVVALRTE